MANPNIVAVTEILGESVAANATTSLSDLVVNATSSGKVYKINSVIASNIDTISSQDITVNFNTSSTDYALAKNITIPTTSSLVVISKDSGIYLREGDKLTIKAASNSTVQVVCSYEVIS